MKKAIVISILIFGLLASGPASAQYLWMDVIGEQTAATGDEITINFYAHAETADELSLFNVDVGFDDNELDYTSLTYASGFSEMTGFGLSATYTYDGSDAFTGASLIATVNGDPGTSSTIAMSAGDDQLLFSIVFTVTDVEYDWTGEDVWVEWYGGGVIAGVFWSGASAVEDVGTSSADATALGDGGADFAAPVPVPAAAWLLGSGLLGLVGLRRRSR